MYGKMTALITFLKAVDGVEDSKVLLAAAESRWNKMHSAWHAAGYALDPEYRNGNHKQMSIKEVMSGLKTVIGRIYHKVCVLQIGERMCVMIAVSSPASVSEWVWTSRPPTPSAALQDERKVKKAMAQFKEEFYLMKDPFTPDLMLTAKGEAAHTWWLEHGAPIPEQLQHVAVIVLSQVTSSSSSERNWKEFEFVHNKRRNRLGFDRAKELVKVRRHAFFGAAGASSGAAVRTPLLPDYSQVHNHLVHIGKASKDTEFHPWHAESDSDE